jgi:cytochrome c
MATPHNLTAFLIRGSIQMDDRTNTFAGWTLFALIIALGGTILSGKYFAHHHVEKGGYEVADAAPAGGEAAAAVPINFAEGDPVKGAQVYAKCQSCHTIEAGGANGIGPNLHGVMGKKHGAVAGFAYSDGMVALPGVWDWDAMDKWLAAPKKYLPGTKMSFAGISDPKARADVIRYLNDQGSNLPVPPPPAAGAPAEATEAGAAPADANAAAPAAEAAAPAAK